jgi:hypothetical protein
VCQISCVKYLCQVLNCEVNFAFVLLFQLLVSGLQVELSPSRIRLEDLGCLIILLLICI